MATAPLLDLATWVPILDGDPIAAAMYNRHYSADRSRARREARGTLQFGGPSSRLILMTPARDALFGWRRQKVRDDDQLGVECFVFRNEGRQLSSALIVEADEIADARWPGERHFTFVDAKKTAGRRGSLSPVGQCFIQAGWVFVVDTDGEPKLSKRRRLHILERAAA